MQALSLFLHSPMVASTTVCCTSDHTSTRRALFQLIHVTYGLLIHAFLNTAPNLIIDRVKVRAFGRPYVTWYEFRCSLAQTLDCGTCMGSARYPAGTRTRRLPDVGLQEASGAIAEYLINMHRLPSSPAPQRSVRDSAKQTVGVNVVLLRFTRCVNTVVLEVHMQFNCKYLLICKEDKIDGLSGNLLNNFITQLKRVMQLASVSSCAWCFLTHFRRNSSRINRTTMNDGCPFLSQSVVLYDVSEVRLSDWKQGHWQGQGLGSVVDVALASEAEGCGFDTPTGRQVPTTARGFPN